MAAFFIDKISNTHCFTWIAIVVQIPRGTHKEYCLKNDFLGGAPIPTQGALPITYPEPLWSGKRNSCFIFRFYIFLPYF